MICQDVTLYAAVAPENEGILAPSAARICRNRRQTVLSVYGLNTSDPRVKPHDCSHRINPHLLVSHSIPFSLVKTFYKFKILLKVGKFSVAHATSGALCAIFVRTLPVSTLTQLINRRSTDRHYPYDMQMSSNGCMQMNGLLVKRGSLQTDWASTRSNR